MTIYLTGFHITELAGFTTASFSFEWMRFENDVRTKLAISP